MLVSLQSLGGQKEILVCYSTATVIGGIVKGNIKMIFQAINLNNIPSMIQSI